MSCEYENCFIGKRGYKHWHIDEDTISFISPEKRGINIKEIMEEGREFDTRCKNDTHGSDSSVG